MLVQNKSQTNALTILIVDDIFMQRVILTEALQNILGSSVQIEQAEDGDKAVAKVIEKIKKNNVNYSLIFMDYNMPAKNLQYENGAAATLGIRKIEKELELKQADISKIITYTSDTRQEPYPGSDAIIPKPCTTQDIETVLQIVALS